jgi:ABC-type transport system involved in cytochrome c biogenesis permease subunit
VIPTALAFALYLFGMAGRWPAYAGLVVQAGYLAYRGFVLGRIPLVGVHDTVNFLAASTLAFGIAVDRAYGSRRGLLQAVSGVAAFFTAVAMTGAPHAMPLPPVLRTYWFELHVALSFFSYALFGVAAVLGVIYLKSAEPEAERLEYKTVFVGWAFFSISMIFGGVWAFLAWGTYWLWTPKEIWTSILWLYYGLYLHLRYLKGWQGRPAAVMGVVGFGVVLFTYLGVSLLMKSSHSF